MTLRVPKNTLTTNYRRHKYTEKMIQTSVTPNGMFPMYKRLACRLMALPAKGIVVLSVIAAGGTLIVCGI